MFSPPAHARKTIQEVIFGERITALLFHPAHSSCHGN